MADEISQGPGFEPDTVSQRRVRVERRRARREPPRTIADARAIVRAIAQRRIENDRWVRVWRLVEQGVYLFALAGAYLLYYLIEKMNEALTLSGIGF